MNVRLVITGDDPNQGATFVADELVEPIRWSLMPGAEFHQLWAADELPTFPHDGSPSVAPQWYPPAGGFRFAIVTLPPADTPPPRDIDVEAAFAEADVKLPGLTSALDLTDPGMNRSDSTDLIVVLSGEVVMELSDGAEKTLRQGDAAVQNGTRHRWHNRTREPVVFAVVLIGAKDRGDV